MVQQYRHTDSCDTKGQDETVLAVLDIFIQMNTAYRMFDLVNSGGWVTTEALSPPLSVNTWYNPVACNPAWPSYRNTMDLSH